LRPNPELERVVAATLYEGYLLYPYRQSVKSQVRWNFGVLFPPAFQAEHSDSERSSISTECILQCPGKASLEIELRFLHVFESTDRGEERRLQAEARTLSVPIPRLRSTGCRVEFSQTLHVAGDPLDEQPQGRHCRPLEIHVRVSARDLSPGILLVAAVSENATPAPAALTRAEALRWAMVSTHHVLQATGATFVSMTSPPPGLGAAVASCSNLGTWPVLVGPGDDTMLSAPIILEDHPRIAPASPGDLFDATEVDELLSLNILALGEDERQDVLRTDPLAARLLQRTEALTKDDFMRMHGIMRPVAPGDDGG
jgi:hypothetical protein